MSELNEVALAAEGIERTFHQGDTDLSILRGAGFTLNRGEIVALVAPSGAGKSTLLQIAGLLERPDAGEIVVAGEPCGRLGDDARTQIRRRRIGFVYQFHHLLPEFSALENVLLPQMIAGQAGGEAKARSAKLLELVGLGARLEHRPGQLSGGEQQRVAIARALANRPLVLLADEPTGNLDPETAERVFGLMVDVVRRGGLAALVATHNPDLAHRMDRVLTIEAGQVAQLA